MTEIYLVRHGQTEANKNYIVQGRMDNPLNEIGMKEAYQTGLFFKDNNLCFDNIISSPLKRAYKTAVQINHGMKSAKPIIIDKDLIERNFGNYDGKKISDEYYDLIHRGEVENMEKNEVLEERALSTMKKIANKYPGKRILVVTHSHFIKGFLINLLEDFTYMTYLKNCSINKIVYEENKFNIVSFNLDPLN